MRARESGGTGRRTGFRFQRRKACGFESRLSHVPDGRRVAARAAFGQTTPFRPPRSRAGPATHHEELPAMQVSVETLGNLERRMTFRLPAERVDTQVGGRLKEIARTARIKGFRPGKVPTKVIEQRYGDQVRQEILDGMLRESFDSAIRENEQIG